MTGSPAQTSPLTAASIHAVSYITYRNEITSVHPLLPTCSRPLKQLASQIPGARLMTNHPGHAAAGGQNNAPAAVNHCFCFWPNLSKCHPLVVLRGNTRGSHFDKLGQEQNHSCSRVLYDLLRLLQQRPQLCRLRGISKPSSMLPLAKQLCLIAGGAACAPAAPRCSVQVAMLTHLLLRAIRYVDLLGGSAACLLQAAA